MKQFLIPRLGCGVKERPATSSLIGMLSMIKPVLANKSRLPPMKHGNSCRTPMAVLAAFLFAILFPTAFAEAGANQEIGVPQPMEMRAKGCFGVVLSPDGDGFYSVRDGLLTHYRIAPFKKIGSVAIDEAQLKDIPEKDSCRVLITDDSSKLVLVFREWLVSLDSRTGVINKKLKREGELKRWILEASTLNENDLVILEASPGRGFRLTVLDARSLQLKGQFSDLKERFGFAYSDDSAPYITKIQDRLYLSSGRSLVVLNSKTYAPELALTRRHATSERISSDYRNLYVNNARFVTDHLSHIGKDYGEAVERSILVFDQETRQISFEEFDFDKERKKTYVRDKYDPMLFTPSRNSDFVANRPSWAPYVIIGRRTTNITYLFHQYESGEAILTKLQPEGRGRIQNFQLTPGARQYLMMKTSAGKVVPINDATFTKYHADGAH